MSTSKPKLLFVIPQDLLNKIEDFRFSKRIASRAEAIRQLIASGLEAEKSKKKK